MVVHFATNVARYNILGAKKCGEVCRKKVGLIPTTYLQKTVLTAKKHCFPRELILDICRFVLNSSSDGKHALYFISLKVLWRRVVIH